MNPKYISGYWPSMDGGYYVYGIESENGGIENPIGCYGSPEEAKTEADRMNQN